MRRGIPTRAGVKGRGVERPNLDLAKSDRAPRLNQSKSPLSEYLTLQQKFSQSLVANIGREAGKKLWTRCLNDGSTHRLRYLGHRLVMYGFVGVSLANSQDININPLPICKHLADLFSTQEEPDSKPIGQKVEDYQFGRLIATGCDAAVYEVQETKSSSQQYTGPLFRSSSLESVTEEESLSEESIISEEEYEIVHEESFELISPESSDVEMESVTSDVPSDGLLSQPESLPAESVCIKVMFNYGISSNSASIERAMRRELVPALTTDDCDSYLRGAHVKKKPTRQLPPHPNIIPIYGWFVDNTPLLEDALDVYPIALPLRLCEDGCGRNSTMFIVMKQYESTLAEHLQACGPPDTRDGVLLLLQLLHGIQHLQQNNIAHRDLKSDNLLMEWSEGHPRLVLSDFGHCLTSPLLMPYPNDCMDKGGNGKLMAPEIATAKPGPGSYLDFRASDSWAAGTIAYEIFGGANPFYTSAFDGRFYKEDELPALPPSVPACVQKVVRGLLRRDPNKRLPSSVAASVLALWLWAPEEWHSQAPSQLDVLRWLVNYMSAAALLGVPERQQMALFLSQLEWRTLWQAIELIAAADEN